MGFEGETMKGNKGGAQVKQNKGQKTHEFSDPHKAGKPVKPGSGTPAVEIRGTNVHAKQIAGVTRPHSHNEGSHDGKIREHADHKD